MAYLTMEFNSMALCRGVEIKVFLPTDGLSTKQWEAPYKTCYFLPGYSVDASSILTYINLRKQCELKEIHSFPSEEYFIIGTERYRSELFTEAVSGDHLSGNACRSFEVVACAC